MTPPFGPCEPPLPLAQRVELLAEKSSAGSLTADERAEYTRIVQLNDLISAVWLQLPTDRGESQDL